MERIKRPPPIGARIIKSSIAVALCMIVFYFRTLLPIGNGIPFYSALAALWCMQSNNENTRTNAGQRSIGTLIGAAFGFLFVIMLRIYNIQTPIAVYLLGSAVIIPVIYTAVILNKRNAAFFSCVVFLSIGLTHSFDDNPYLFVFNRVLDTFIGIGIGVFVNNFHLPYRHKDKTLYVCGIDSVLIPDDHSTSQYSNVELNRLIENGLKFTISTIRTPAEVTSLMNGVDLRLPLIVMDGAAIYDLNRKEYLEKEYLPSNVSDIAERIIREKGMHCFVNIMYDSTLLIFYGDLKNEPEKKLYETHKHSPYRNYVKNSYRRHDDTENVLYLTVLDERLKIADLSGALRNTLGSSARITVSDSEYEGYQCLKVFSPLASKHNMMSKLKKYTDSEKILTFGSIKGKYDVYIGDGGGNATVKKIKKLYLTSNYH